MSEAISWSVTANGASGGSASAVGSTEGDATVSATVRLEPAMSAVRDLAFQVETGSAVTFLAITSSLNDGSVQVTPAGGSAIAMSGPILLVGAAVSLFAGDLGTIGVQNTSADRPATFSVLIGLTL
ncbi:MAG: hypothetical protein ACOCY0_00445 [Roseicyclus sp.]